MRSGSFTTNLGVIRYWVTDAPLAGKPWLVLLPGLTADHRLFARQIKYFTGRYNLFVWDAPAHYRSRPFELAFDLDDMARWLGEILDVEGIERSVLVGQSLGGYISQAFMDLFPGRAAGFVSIDSAPLQKRFYPDWELAALKRMDAITRYIPWSVLKPWGAWGTATTKYGRHLAYRFLETYGETEYRRLMVFGYGMLARAVEKDRAYRIDCPTLLICGQRDHAGDVKTYNRKWSRAIGCPVHWIRGAGHNSNTDRPGEINSLIEGFVGSLQ